MTVPEPRAAIGVNRPEHVYRGGEAVQGVLTDYQRTILLLASRGMTYDQIATRLDLSRNAIQQTAQRIFKFLSANNIAHAVSIAWERGYLTGTGHHGSDRARAEHASRGEPRCPACKAGGLANVHAVVESDRAIRKVMRS